MTRGEGGREALGVLTSSRGGTRGVGDMCDRDNHNIVIAGVCNNNDSNEIVYFSTYCASYC